MATYVWRRAADGDFSVPSNWTLDGTNPASMVPGPSDTALFPNATAASVSGNGDVLQLVTADPRSNWNFTGQVAIGNLSVTGAATLSSGGRFTVSGSGSVAPNTTGTLIVTAGSSYLSSAPAQTADYLLNIASASGTSGGLYVTGQGAMVDLGNNPASVGLNGAGVIAVSGGATARFVTSDPNAVASLAVGRAGQGFVGVGGNNAVLQVVGALYAGRGPGSTGTLRIGGGGSFQELAVGTGNASTFGSGGTLGRSGPFATSGQGFLQVLAGDSGQPGGVATFGDGLNFGSNGAVGFGSIQGVLTVGGPIRIGTGTTATGGTGYLEVTSGGTVRSTAVADTSTTYLTLGNAASTSGTVFVDGPGSTLDVGANAVGIGTVGAGALSVSHNAVLKASTGSSALRSALSAANQTSTSASLSVAYGAAAYIGGYAYFARAGVASLVVTGSSSLTAGSAGSGATPSYGITIGDGTPATDASGNPNSPLYFGGLGVANVNNLSVLHSLGNLNVGYRGTSGNLTVDAISSATADGQVRVGAGTDRVGGSGVVTIQNNSFVLSGAQHTQGQAGIDIGVDAGTTGVVNVIGAGSFLNANGARLTVGNAGVGVLNVVNGATALSGAVYSDTEAALAVGGASGGNGQLTVLGAGSLLNASGSAVIGGNDRGSGVAAGGTGIAYATRGGTLLTGAMTVEPGSLLAVDTAAAASIRGNLTNLGTVSSSAQLGVQGSLSGSGTLALTGGLTDIGTISSTTVDFGTGTEVGTLRVHGVSGNTVVNNFHFGDVIDLAAGVTGVSLSGNTLTAGGGTFTLNSAPANYVYQLYGDAAGGRELLLKPVTSNSFYTGQLDYLQFQFVVPTSTEDLQVTAFLPNAYIKTGSGNDTLKALAGNNVLDASGGSNTIIGSPGTDGGRDTFIVNATGGGVTDTFYNMHPGDVVQIFGFNPTNTPTVQQGSLGATLSAALNGSNANFIFAGIDVATYQQHFAFSGGNANGSDYLLIQYT